MANPKLFKAFTCSRGLALSSGSTATADSIYLLFSTPHCLPSDSDEPPAQLLAVNMFPRQWVFIVCLCFIVKKEKTEMNLRKWIQTCSCPECINYFHSSVLGLFKADSLWSSQYNLPSNNCNFWSGSWNFWSGIKWSYLMKNAIVFWVQVPTGAASIAIEHIDVGI